MAISFSKLKNGQWGIRGTGIKIGVANSVTKRDGSTTTAVASRILWTGEDGTQIAEIGNTSHSTKRRGGCDCTDDCCSRGCRCEAHCNCRGGNIYDCE